MQQVVRSGTDFYGASAQLAMQSAVLVYLCQNQNQKSFTVRLPRVRVLNEIGVGKLAFFASKLPYLRNGARLPLNTNRKLHMHF